MNVLMALPKGRLGDELLPLLQGTPFELDGLALKTRRLLVPTATPGLQAILLKGTDLPRYVAGGVAALGVVGSDTLDELEADLLELADLGRGGCRLSLCAPEGQTLESLRSLPHLRLATKFLQATRRWLRREGMTAELVPLQSSVELAPVLGLADATVDLVQTGATLKAHGLVEVAGLGWSSARLIAGRSAFLSEPEKISAYAQALKAIWRT